MDLRSNRYIVLPRPSINTLKETEPFKKVFFFASKETPFFLMTPPDNPGAEFIKIVAATIFTIVLTVPGRS